METAKNATNKFTNADYVISTSHQTFVVFNAKKVITVQELTVLPVLIFSIFVMIVRLTNVSIAYLRMF